MKTGLYQELINFTSQLRQYNIDLTTYNYRCRQMSASFNFFQRVKIPFMGKAHNLYGNDSLNKNPSMYLTPVHTMSK